MKKFKGCQVKQALFFLFLFVMSNALAFSKEAKESFEKKGILKNVEKLNWEGIDVIWIKDNRFPTYDITVYYGDGSLSDGDKKGETERMFSLLGKGTPKYSFKEIAEQFEFWSFSGGPNVYHEYSSYNFSGLLKDLLPTMKLMLVFWPVSKRGLSIFVLFPINLLFEPFMPIVVEYYHSFL